MELKVIFISKGNASYSFGQKTLGLKLVREARFILSLNISLCLFPEIINGTSDNIRLDLTEQDALLCGGLFEHDNKVLVNVEPKSLNSFCDLVPFISSQNPSTGEVTKVDFAFLPRQDDVFAFWVSCGCPIDWDVEKCLENQKMPNPKEVEA